MYLNDHDTVFCTLAIGDEYRERVAFQLQSIIKFTHHDVYVVTDDVNAFGNYYGPRVHYVPFDETLTDLPLKSQTGVFNYNLKMVPIRWTVENVRAAVTVYMDADSFLFGWDRMFHRFFPAGEQGIWGRFRNALNDSSDHRIVLEKAARMGIDISHMDTRLPIENIMFFKNGHMLSPFFNEWHRLAKLSHEVGATSFYEAVEMAIAIYNTGLPYVHLDNTCAFIDNFRTIHHGKIHIPFVI
jgi:hypothetical protein